MEKTIGEIAQLLGGRLEGNPAAIVSSFGTIEEAKPGQLSFIANAKYEKYLYSTQATALLVRKDLVPTEQYSTALIFVEDPYLALAKLMQYVATVQASHPKGISELASVHPSVELPEDCFVGAFVYIDEGARIGCGTQLHPHCYVGKGVEIGERSILYPRVTLYPEVCIGKRCILHSGAVIGSDGFGFAPGSDGYQKIPQLGTVVVGDDVEIGANTCIDRAVIDKTTIADGVKLDNLVQIAHNCSVGKHSVISAQTGLAGSTRIGEWCRTGGQVGFAGHGTIGNRCEIGGQSGVLGSLPDGSRVMGTPQMDARSALRVYASLPKLPQIARELQQLKKQLSILEEKCNSTPSNPPSNSKE